MKSFSNICYCEKTKQYLDIHLPESDRFPVFIYFHGGGLRTGDKSKQTVLFNYLTEHGVAVVSANYRMYPAARYPDFLTDSAKAVAWTIKNIGAYGEPSGIYVGGSSAGGYISQMLCFDEAWLSEQGIEASEISGFLLDAGQPTCHFNVLRERGIDTRRVIIDESAPLYHVDDKRAYPQMIVIVSDNDMENRYEQTMLLISTLRHFGHSDNVQLKVMHGKHCSYVNATDENGDSVLGKIALELIKNNKRKLD